ncbi:hypothetical protein ACLKA7_015680 [Drosophila subpalustris]
MYFIWLLLLILPQLLALSRAQDSAYNGLRMNQEAASTPSTTRNVANSSYTESTTQTPVTTQLTTKASTAIIPTTNIFERFLTKSHITRSSLVNLVSTTTEGLWFMRTAVNKTNAPPTTAKPTTRTTETTATTTKTTFSIPTTTATSTVPTTTTTSIAIPTTTTTTTTTKSTSTTTTTTKEKPELNRTSAYRHVLHSGHHWSPSTIRSIAKSNANPKPDFSISVVFLVFLGILSEYI